MQVNKWIFNNLSWLWSSRCLLCDSTTRPPHDWLCKSCEGDIGTDQPVCPTCAMPLTGVADSLCGDCQNNPPAYASVYRFAPYDAPLDRLILQFKFQQKLTIGRKLGMLMAQDIRQQRLPLPDVLVPVPLHASRLRQRGYNQALELARPIAKLLNLSIDVESCIREKATTDQIGLPAKLRKSNLKNAFSVNGDFRDKRVTIIDDVMTTGSTVNELSQQLINAGARQVNVWVCARAVL